MKKYMVLTGLIAAAFLLSYCNPAKKAAASAAPPKSTYETGVSALVMGHCSPCHIPAKGGNKKAYDNYANVKGDIDEIIRRIELNPGERGFMPFKKTAKLSDSTINAFKQWRTDGLLEK
jgi:mono/diheme cytochrome c family protein